MCREGLVGENQYHFAVGLQRNEKYDLFKFLGSLRRSGDWRLFSLPDHVKRELEKPRKESTLFSSFDNPLDGKYQEFIQNVEISLLMLDVAKLGSGQGKDETWYLPSFFDVQCGQKRRVESQIHTSVKNKDTAINFQKRPKTKQIEEIDLVSDNDTKLSKWFSKKTKYFEDESDYDGCPDEGWG
jgi:hypothetical protein